MGDPKHLSHLTKRKAFRFHFLGEFSLGSCGLFGRFLRLAAKLFCALPKRFNLTRQNRDYLNFKIGWSKSRLECKGLNHLAFCPIETTSLRNNSELFTL